MDTHSLDDEMDTSSPSQVNTLSKSPFRVQHHHPNNSNNKMDNDEEVTMPHPSENDKLTLSAILEGQVESIRVEDVQIKNEASDHPQHGYCIECEDQPAEIHCEQCTDDYCEVCFAHLHRKGTRKKHPFRNLKPAAASNTNQNITQDKATESSQVPESGSIPEEDLLTMHNHKPITSITISPSGPQPSLQSSVGDWFVERAKYIPVRLTLQERKYLRLLEAALNVSEYTDKIDILSYTSKSKRIVVQIKELCSILSGLVLAADYKTGQALFQDRDFAANDEFFQDIFELGRRHKIMNPEKMRSTYGKLVYMLQDSQIPEVQDMLEFKCVKPIQTVYGVFEEHSALDILRDDLINMATMEIISDSSKNRYQIQKEIKQKECAIEILSRKYARSNLSSETIKQCLYSIGDNHAFLRTNRDPCDKMIKYLKQYFNPSSPQQGFSLAIQAGREGARLSHGHERQYQYVIQSLTLWREILHDMFMLWTLAEGDLLDQDNYYRLRDTGQGLNRVQAAPKVSRMMHVILHRAQQRVGSWVGSSVIHLGDHNVPNALMFIDKYTQIYRILLPIVTCIEKLQEVSDVNDHLKNYIQSAFGGVERARQAILTDFFRHAFDGSGADNFFDAGSCIDGRLTSAWNWCSQLEKKEYFSLFLLTGFIGFDGQF